MPGARTNALPLEISIVDNGPGIPPELIDNIFEPFVSSKVNGSGLGLSLVSKILADHGGVIECDSHEGRTEFRVINGWNGNCFRRRSYNSHGLEPSADPCRMPRAGNIDHRHALAMG